MTDQEATMPEQMTPFETMAQRITYDWMRHLGYTDETIALAESQTCKSCGCERIEYGWDCSDENGKSNHPERDDLIDAAEYVMFVLEHPAVRDDKAELVKALRTARGSLAAVGVFVGRGLGPDFMPALSANNEADARELGRAYWAVWDALAAVGEGEA